MLSFFILMPLAGLIILNLPFGAWLRRMAYGYGLAACLVQMALLVSPWGSFWTRPDPLERVLYLGLKADGLSVVLLLAIGVVLFASLMVSHALLMGERRRFHGVILLLVAMVGMNGTVLLSDVFSLYVFLEITSVASFILISLHRDKPALEGAFKYIVLSLIASMLMLSAVALLLLVTGDTSFAGVRTALEAHGRTPLASIAMGAFVAGVLIKGGLVPFHGWLPAAYGAAPAPVSIFLAGIATKVSGLYTLLRLTNTVFVPSPALNQTLLLIGAVSIVVGAFAALGQQDLKWLLAYSSISQVGYIVLGLGCGTLLGFMGAIFHLFNHAVFKSLLFVNAAAVEQRLGTTDMNRMGGLGSRMPVTGATSVIAILSAAGIPPLAGFWSKLLIVLALWQTAHYGYAVLAVLLGVVTLGYLLLMQRRVFFGQVPESLASVREADRGLVVPAVVLAAITVLVGLLFPFVLSTFP